MNFGSACGLFVLGFEGLVLPAAIAEWLSRGLAGVALFSRNIADPEQVRSLCRAVREAARGGPPPIIAVDEEGGRVQRLRDLIGRFPPARVLGREGPGAARAAAASIGAGLRDLGFNVDFAPVLDVDSNPANPIIGDRAFSSDPSSAARLAVAFLEGLRSAGIQGCGKHFPGHGDADADSHFDLPEIRADRDTLESRELVPFRAAVEAGVGLLMTAHCVYPALDPDLPATLSRPILCGILRERLGFDGCVISDDLGMKAIAERFSTEEVLVRGLEAGVDLFLHCGAGPESFGLIDALQSLLDRGEVHPDQVRRAQARVHALRDRLA